MLRTNNLFLFPKLSVNKMNLLPEVRKESVNGGSVGAEVELQDILVMPRVLGHKSSNKHKELGTLNEKDHES